MTTILFEHGVIPNGREGYGFLPYVEEDGLPSCNTWQASGYDFETAERLSKEMAESKASRFVGDWTLIIRPFAEPPTAKRR